MKLEHPREEVIAFTSLGKGYFEKKMNCLELALSEKKLISS